MTLVFSLCASALVSSKDLSLRLLAMWSIQLVLASTGRTATITLLCLGCIITPLE